MWRPISLAILLLAPPASAADGPDRGFEEIVVTAQRKEERLLDVPISVSAFDGEFVAAASIDGVHELAEFAPNVFVRAALCGRPAVDLPHVPPITSRNESGQVVYEAPAGTGERCSFGANKRGLDLLLLRTVSGRGDGGSRLPPGKP